MGKSSLLNRILGQRKLAKVSSTPGRTRSLNFFRIDNRFYLVDLPGYGYAKVSRALSEHWGALIEEYLTLGEDLIGMVLLLDCRRDPTEQDIELIEWLRERQLPVMVAMTKSDKLSKDRQLRKVRQVEQEMGAAAMAFSAVTGTGTSELLGSVRQLVKDHLQHIKDKHNG